MLVTLTGSVNKTVRNYGAWNWNDLQIYHDGSNSVQ